MNWNNLEKNIKHKMNSRSITPSDDSWNQLDKMLTSAEKNKPKQVFFWLSAAASIIGIAFIGIYTITQNSSVEKNDSLLVVQENTVQKDSAKTTDKSEKAIIINPITRLQPTAKMAESKLENDELNLLKNDENNNQKQKNNNQNNVILTDKPIDESNLNQQKTMVVNPIILLSSAETSKETLLKNNPIKVDASSLLSQVDGELSQTFTEKALQTINKNYQNIKETIALRNIKD